MIKDEIWILGDNRPGTISQAIGLAEEIGFEYKIINITYSILSRLPNFILSNSLLRFSCETRKKIAELNYLPSVIISAGRRAAPLALYLKKKSQNSLKIIQIMNPDLDFKKFDFVVLPKHDGIKEENFPNLITTIGALTKTNENLIEREKQKFASWFNQIENKKIALLFGGSSNKTKFSKESAVKLAKIVSTITQEMNATLLVLNSRRSGDELSHELRSNLDCNFKFFDWKEVSKENPYLAILGYADFFIITGDSVSMISECCSTGKPVYIFDEKEISAPKHRKFHHNLFHENYAKRLNHKLLTLENFTSKQLHETKRVAAIIRSKF